MHPPAQGVRHLPMTARLDVVGRRLTVAVDGRRRRRRFGRLRTFGGRYADGDQVRPGRQLEHIGRGQRHHRLRGQFRIDGWRAEHLNPDPIACHAQDVRRRELDP